MTKSRDLANAATALNAVTATELGFVDGVTSAIQTQIDTKLATATAATTYVPNSLADAKGDLLTATADNTPARLAVGSNGDTIVADSSTATGLKWATPASGSTAVGASAYNSVGQSLTAYTLTALALNTENYDTNTFHDNTTNNSRFTIPTGYAGKYTVSATISLTPSGDITTHLYKNGSAVALGTNAGQISRFANVAVQLTYNANFDISLAVGDYVQVVVNPGAGGITTVSQVVSIQYIGA